MLTDVKPNTNEAKNQKNIHDFPGGLFAATNAVEVRRAQALIAARIASAKVKMLSETMMITPAIAEHILTKHNRGNRTVSPSRVQKYANEMKAGNFILTAQGLSFDRNGILNNGQHRLHAIVLSGTAVTMYVTFGEDRAAFAVIDTQGTRTGGDVLSILNYKNSNNLAATARTLEAIEGGIASKRKFGFPNDRLVEFVNAHPRLPEAVTMSLGTAKKFRCSSSPIGAAFYLILTKSKRPELLVSFVACLIDGSGLLKNSPLLRLRDGLQTRTLTESILDNYSRNIALTAIIVLTWNKWLKDRAGGIKWDGKDSFPEVE